MKKCLFIVFILLPCFLQAESNPALQKVAHDFWQWRFSQQPASGDDILRVERPAGWTPDYSPKALVSYREMYTLWKTQLGALDKSGFSRSDSVDYLCLRSAIERVNWELNVLKLLNRSPDFYLHQTLGALYELLLIYPPLHQDRVREIITRVKSFPQTLRDARQNLTEPVAGFAKIALSRLGNVAQKMDATLIELKKLSDESLHAELDQAFTNGSKALMQYRQWLVKQLPHMAAQFSIGRDAYVYFLKNIALVPLTPEEMMLLGRHEWNRSVAFETYQKLRNKDLPNLVLFESAGAEIAQADKDELAVREFLETHEIMSVPDWLQRYFYRPKPAHLVPLGYMGVNDDLTSETRLDEPAVRYINEPDSSLGYFTLSMALDPRPIILHEGIPGHFYQLARSWKNTNPVRRRFVDSGSIEGIGLYVEELMLQFGLFDDRPRVKEIIYNYMRLRALRVEVDIKLATGEFTIEEGGRYLAETVPMDLKTGIGEAGFFAYNPGQAISYQVGKIQIFQFLSDAKVKLGHDFVLRDFHDYLMENGNVPIALLRWEYLGMNDEVAQFFD